MQHWHIPKETSENFEKSYCFGVTLKLHNNLATESRYNVLYPDLSILFVAGAENSAIISEENGACLDFFEECGILKCGWCFIYRLRYEMLNEIRKENVYEDVLQFILE